MVDLTNKKLNPSYTRKTPSAGLLSFEFVFIMAYSILRVPGNLNVSVTIESPCQYCCSSARNKVIDVTILGCALKV